MDLELGDEPIVDEQLGKNWAQIPSYARAVLYNVALHPSGLIRNGLLTALQKQSLRVEKRGFDRVTLKPVLGWLYQMGWLEPPSEQVGQPVCLTRGRRNTVLLGLVKEWGQWASKLRDAFPEREAWKIETRDDTEAQLWLSLLEGDVSESIPKTQRLMGFL